MNPLSGLWQTQEVNADFQTYKTLLIPPGEVEFRDTVPETLPTETVLEITEDPQYRNAARANGGEGRPIEGEWNLDDRSLRDSIFEYLSDVYGDAITAPENTEANEMDCYDDSVDFTDAVIDREGNIELRADLYLESNSPKSVNRVIYGDQAGEIIVTGKFPDGIEDLPNGVTDQF